MSHKLCHIRRMTCRGSSVAEQYNCGEMVKGGVGWRRGGRVRIPQQQSRRNSNEQGVGVRVDDISNQTHKDQIYVKI